MSNNTTKKSSAQHKLHVLMDGNWKAKCLSHQDGYQCPGGRWGRYIPLAWKGCESKTRTHNFSDVSVRLENIIFPFWTISEILSPLSGPVFSKQNKATLLFSYIMSALETTVSFISHTNTLWWIFQQVLMLFSKKVLSAPQNDQLIHTRCSHSHNYRCPWYFPGTS